MLAKIKALATATRAFRAGIAYGMKPTPENKERLICAAENDMGKPRQQWTPDDWQLFDQQVAVLDEARQPPRP